MKGMTKWKVGGEIFATHGSTEDMIQQVGKASAVIKTMCGIGNNAAWSCCLEALDHIRTHPNYRQRVKQGFKQAMEAFRAYERRLLYDQEASLFQIDEMAPEYRKRYGNITDRQYYDYWCSTGATVYMQRHRWVTSLWNKYRLSLINHHVKNEDSLAWGMTACSTLRLAEAVYNHVIDVCVADYGVPSPLLKAIFGPLNIHAIGDKWDAALDMLEPVRYTLEDIEQKNIQAGLDQLLEEWTSVATMCDALTESTEAFDEVFRTKGEQKKALRQIAEMRE